MFGNGGTVFFGRIPFITVPVIIGILFVETVHIIITIRFGQNRCSSYRKVFSIAFDYRGMRDTGIFIKSYRWVSAPCGSFSFMPR